MELPLLRSNRHSTACPDGEVTDEELEVGTRAAAALASLTASVTKVLQTDGDFTHFAYAAAKFALAATLALVVFIYVVKDEPSNGWWAVVVVLSYACSKIWEMFVEAVEAFERARYLRVVIHRDGTKSSQYLIEAVRQELGSMVPRHEVEACMGHEDEGLALAKGGFARTYRVEFSTWSGAQKQMIELRIQGRLLMVEVITQRGTDIICGTPPMPQRVETLTLRVRSEDRVADMAALKAWLQLAYEKYMEAIPGVVKVYALQDPGGDWMPEWKQVQCIAAPRCVSSLSLGSTPGRVLGGRIFIEAPWMHDLFSLGTFAKECNTVVAVLLYGAKGSGKTKFVECMAGKLQIPVYHFNLRSTLLSDDRLVQLMSRNSIFSDFVILHFDEVQAALSHWDSESSEGRTDCLRTPQRGVSLEGIEAALDSEVAPRQGVVIFTGSSLVSLLRKRHNTVGFFRRFHRIIEIPPVDNSFARECFLGVLTGVGAVNAEAKWHDFEQAWFSRAGSSAIDALTKYLDLHICRAHQRRWIVAQTSGGCKVVPQFQAEFLAALCDPREVELFIQEYAGGIHAPPTAEEVNDINSQTGA